MNYPPGLELVTGDMYTLRPGSNLRVPVRVTSGSHASLDLALNDGRSLPGSLLGRLKIEQFGDDFYVNLRNMQLSDSGSYLIQAKNTAGTSQLPIRVSVNTVPLSPTGPLVVSVQEATPLTFASKVLLSWRPPALREEEKQSGVPTEPIEGYLVERKDGRRRAHFSQGVRLGGADSLELEVPDLQPGIEYMFRVSAYNAIGYSEPLYSEPVIIKSPVDVPDAPGGPLDCLDFTSNSLRLQWSPPSNDGGSDLLRYHIELKEVGDPTGWQPVSSVTAAGPTEYSISSLREGLAYRFRVRAVNAQGPGAWLETESTISFKRPVTAPSAPEAPFRLIPDGENAVQLSWRAPQDDGGSCIADFIVEANLGREDNWQQACVVKDLRARVERLVPEGSYSFRVSARNEVGKTGDALYSEIYKPSAPLSPPGPPGAPLVTTMMGVGQVQLDWRPAPTGGSSGYGAPLEYRVESWDNAKSRWAYVTRSLAAEGTSLIVSGLRSGSELRFRVRAENIAGLGPSLEMEKPILIASPFSPPSAPVGPIHISEVQMGQSAADGSVRLSWQPPLEDGGTPITSYLVQMRYFNSTVWNRVRHLQSVLTFGSDEEGGEETVALVPGTASRYTLLQTSLPVTGLMRTQQYVFRVAAINETGTGTFLTSEVFRMPEDDSCRPKADWVRVVGKGSDNITIEWLVPHDCRVDHGPNRAHHLALDGFRVFLREAHQPEDAWIRVADLDHYIDRLVVGLLRSDKKYYFGVAAINQKNQGEIVSTTEPVSPEAFTTVPNQPLGPLRVSDITADSCRLLWQASMSDGGSPLIGYRVYKREIYRRSWQEIGRISIAPGSLQKELEFIAQYLMEGTSYEFRVVAENINGLSEPLNTSVHIQPRKEIDIPGAPRGPLQIREVAPGEIELSWSPPLQTGGMPLLGYQLELREGRCFIWKPAVTGLVATSPRIGCNPTHRLGGIKPNREYFFRVLAINKEGVSPPLTAEDSYVKRAQLYPPKSVRGRRVQGEDAEDEMGRRRIEIVWEVSAEQRGDFRANGFQIEQLDVDSKSADWTQVDFLPVTDRARTTYSHILSAPRHECAYRYRVCAVYAEGTSAWVATSVILASEVGRRRPDSSTDRAAARVPPVPSVSVHQAEVEGSGPYRALELEWTPPTGPDAERIRGYKLEDWDDRRSRWKPVIDLPSEAPRHISFLLSEEQQLPGKLETRRMRIISLGDTSRSVPIEFQLQPESLACRTTPTLPQSSPTDPTEWFSLPSSVGWRRALPEDGQAERALTETITEDAERKTMRDVDEFIYQRRKRALELGRGTTGSGLTPSYGTMMTPRFDPAPLDSEMNRGLASRLSDVESPLLFDEPQRSASRVTGFSPQTPGLLSGKLTVREVGPTFVRLEWSDVARGLPSCISSYEVQQWEPRAGRWVKTAQVPTDVTDYTVMGLRSPDYTVKDPPGWWFRVLPKADKDRLVGTPLLLDRPVLLRKQATIPSSVWGVEISPVTGISLDNCHLDVAWLRPSNDGGSELLGYRLLIYNADTGEDREIVVPPQCTTHRIEPLNGANTYRITITALNIVGESIPVTSTAPRCPGSTDIPPVPKAPRDLIATPLAEPGSDEVYCRLSWKPPSTLCQIDFYFVEKWDSRCKQWVPCKKVPASVTDIEVPHLIGDLLYAFRVRSQNETGLSEPVITKDYVRPGATRERAAVIAAPPPPPMGPLRLEQSKMERSIYRLRQATEDAYRALDLSWSPPAPERHLDQEFGRPSTYLLEAKRRGQKSWARIGQLPVSEGNLWRVMVGPEPTQGHGFFAGMPLPNMPINQHRPAEGFDVPLFRP
ncbi:unnamed protein product, partial [Protopolystoma xenopodis]